MNDKHIQLRMPLSLPLIHKRVVQRFRKHPPDFARLYHKLQTTNPEAANWLYSAAEAVAPANNEDKEKYALLALSLYYMLHEQLVTDKLSAAYGDSFDSPIDFSAVMEANEGPPNN